jgi:hypothetical protein
LSRIDTFTLGHAPSSRRVTIVGIVLSLLLASPIAAQASAGGWLTNTTNNGGSRATIEGTANYPNNGGVIATVRVQSDLTSDAGLFQIGHIAEGSNFTTVCGTNTIGLMVERKPVGDSYRCNAFFESFGSNHIFTVKHASDGWSAFDDGFLQDGPFSGLGFAHGVAFAVGEFNGGAPTSYSMTYGPQGDKPWQRLTSGGSWSTVTAGSSFNDGGWSLGSPPSPFTISR